MLSSKIQHSHDLLTDYLTLIRTRLIDLGGAPSEKNESVALRLVQQAVEEFNSSGRILPKVVEICIFSSPFYIGCFLPLLLSASAREKAPRRRLIEKLFR